jgi:hypothetical protein
MGQFSQFEVGFKVGFKEGYCYTSNPNSGFFCTPPPPPLPPLPVYPESSAVWLDGYNRGFQTGNSKRYQDDYKINTPPQTNFNPPKFNPYVPQNPILLLTPEERDLYYRNKALKEQAQVEALGALLEAIFTPRPKTTEEKLRDEMEEAKIKLKMEQEKIERAIRKEARRLVIGSDKYISFQKNKNRWLAIGGASTIIATYSNFQANKLATKYLTATNDAVSIKKKANFFYQITPICVFVSGISIFEFLHKKSKIKNAKPPSFGLRPIISNEGFGLSLNL